MAAAVGDPLASTIVLKNPADQQTVFAEFILTEVV
jgi:hypothetical protein